MSTSLLKHYDQKNPVQQRRSKVVSDTLNEECNDDYINRLFPKCKPRIAVSPSEKQSLGSRRSMDCNANSDFSSSKGLSQRTVNRKNFTNNLNKKYIVAKVYPGIVKRGHSEIGDLNTNSNQNLSRRMEVGSSPPDSTNKFHPETESSGAELDLNAVQNSLFLRDSRIEIAGGRELFSQSRNRMGRRGKEQQLRTVAGPKELSEPIGSGEPCISGSEKSGISNRSTDSSIWEPHEKEDKIPDQSQASINISTFQSGHQGHSSHSTGITRSRHSFPGYAYSGYNSTTKNLVNRDNGTCAGTNNNKRRSRAVMEFPPTTPISFRQVHSTPLTIKETVFGSEITSIEKSISRGDDSSKLASRKVDEVSSDLEKPYIYETPLSTRCDGEIVFDDIDEYELDEQHYSPQLHILHSLMNDNSNKDAEKNKRAEDGNTSPSGYESDECSLPAPQAKSLSPNGNKRLIGTLPIADYERSPKRYGLQSRQSDNSCFDSILRQTPRAPSPNNIPPKLPGFPQRVTQKDHEPSASSGISELGSKLPEIFGSELPNTRIDQEKKEVASENRQITTDVIGQLNVKLEATSDNFQTPFIDSCQSSSLCTSGTHSEMVEVPQHQFQDAETVVRPCASLSQNSDPYLYEFSETKRVLEEFFKGSGAVGTAYNTTTALPPNEVDYVLRRQAGNSYVGQRLAGELSLAEESPKMPPRRGGREVVMSLDMNPKDPLSAGGSSLRLITFHEVSRASISPTSRSSQQGDLNRDVNDNDIETASTNTETDLGDTEVGLQVGRRNFTLSPETTDCDSNELESEMSLDYEASVHSSSRVGATMPILEDGLSSGNISETEEDHIHSKPNSASLSANNISSLRTPCGVTGSSISQSIDSVSNPTVLLMKKQISEIEKEIRLRATQQQSQPNGGISIVPGMTSSTAQESPALENNSSNSCHIRISESDSGAGRFDSNDPELDALDPMRPTPPPSPAPGSSIDTRKSATISNPSAVANALTTDAQRNAPSGSENVLKALKDIKEAIQKTKHLHQNSHQVPRADPIPSDLIEGGSFSSSQAAMDGAPSPIWVPRKSNLVGTLSLRRDQSSRSESTHHSSLREPLLRKSRYEETVVDDVSDADTDQETDRLLGQNRTDDDYGFYDDKEKDGVKKKRSKEDLLKHPTVLIEGVLFRARYLGSTQLECEGQPTKATRMIQAEEAVSRIKTEETKQLMNGENLPIIPEPSHLSDLGNTNNSGAAPKKREESCIGCEYEDYLYALGGDESEDDSYEEYYGRKLGNGTRLGLKLNDNNKKLEGHYASIPTQDPLQSSTSSSSSSNAAARAQRKMSLSKITSPIGSISSPSATASNNATKSLHQIPIPFHLSPPCGSALPGTMFHLRFVGSLEVEEEAGFGKKRRKRPKKIMVEEAVTKLKAPEGETQPSTEVDLFISTEKIMVLNTDLKEIMMDHALRTISYIADIGDLVVLMARRRPIPTDTPDETNKLPRPPKMICHVFESDEAQYIAQSIGQAFQVAYMEFLKANGIEDHSFVREMDYQEVLNSQEIFGDELQMFAKKELQKDVVVPKTKGEILGVVIVESGWGSMLPTVVIANLAPAGAAARCGQLNIGDQIIAINGVSLVGLPLSTCQNYIKNSKTQTVVKLTVVPCPPVVEVKIKRPDTKYQLGFSVQNGVICSLLRGGIAERGGVRVGHRIIEINNQSVVAVPHEKIVNLLATSVGEINMKTMPTSMFRLLTGQETPLYI